MDGVDINTTATLLVKLSNLPLGERLPAAINDGSTVLLRYLRLEATPTRRKPYSCNIVSL